MRVSQLHFPDGIEEPSRRRVAAFKRSILHNAEICDGCFEQVRAIGDVQTKRTDLFEHEILEYYERTEHGAQEHDPFNLPSDRYGTCYCRECGEATTNGLKDDPMSLEELTECCKRIYVYLRNHTPLEVDPSILGETLAALKRQRNNQGRDTEILAAATARAIQS